MMNAKWLLRRKRLLLRGGYKLDKKMCSVSDSSILLMTKGRKLIEEENCRKCEINKAVLLLRGKDAYCRECFLLYFTHKFRSTIGKSKQIKPNDEILVCYSGGKNSTALLHLIFHGLNEQSHKKLRFKPTFLVIDEYGGNLEQICSEVNALNFNLYVISLEQVMVKEDSPITVFHSHELSPSKVNMELKEELETLLKNCKEKSALEDLLFHLRYKLICRCSKTLGFKKIFLADSATAISVRMLSHIALGRGSQLSNHVNFKTGHTGLDIFRPMRELLNNEIEEFIQLQKIKVPSFSEDRSTDTSIIDCTNHFVCGLQENYPSTVPTIYKVGDKVTTFDASCISDVTSVASFVTPDQETENTEMAYLCPLCDFPLDIRQGVSSAMNAKLISGRISTLPSNGFPTENKSIGQTSLNEYVCYGCRNIMQSGIPIEKIPFEKPMNVAFKLSSEEMENKLKEFLIND